MSDLLTEIKEGASLIEREMDKYLAHGDCVYGELVRSMKYSAGVGGKRIRPYLTLAVCRMLGGRDEAALPYACALEMVHTYSLIHDDLPCMDDDVTRRGKPTNHVVFGEATALLAGDALLTKAFEILASNPFVSAENKVAAVRLLAENSGADGMIGGQVIDLDGEKRELSYDEFLLMNRLKTGCLIKTGALLGCLAAGYGEDSEEYASAKKFAENIGLAFQIEDDILDYGTEDNKTTFLTFMSVGEAKKRIEELTLEAIEAVNKYDVDGTLRALALGLSKREI